MRKQLETAVVVCCASALFLIAGAVPFKAAAQAPSVPDADTSVMYFTLDTGRGHELRAGA